MFTEELASNSSRKRAEANRTRRRQLKQQQQQKKTALTSTRVTSTATTNSTAPSIALSSHVPSAAKSAKASVSTTSAIQAPIVVTTARSNQPLSVVEKARQQRELRAAEALQQKAALQIQSVYRSHSSNRQLCQAQRESLQKRLQDLHMVRNLLVQQKSSTTYVPPPATTTMLVQQLLFVTTTCHNKKNRSADFDLIQQTLQDAVLPGIQSPDDNMNPVTVWIQYYQGQYRLRRLLRLSLVVALDNTCTQACFASVLEFLRIVLLMKDVSKNGVKSGSLLLLSDQSIQIALTDSISKQDTTLDLIAILRHYFLFRIAGSTNPIPENAMDLRDTCIPAAGRKRAGALFLLLLQAIEKTAEAAQRQRLQIRVMTELLTVPLFTWKVSLEAISYLVKASSADRVPFVELLRTFVNTHGAALAEGQLNEILSLTDVPMTICPATVTQCLLANMIQLGRLCSVLNGSDASQLDFAAATEFFDFVTILLDAVPLMTFSSRDSAVEWITDEKGHQTPIVLSPVILDQCKALLVDSWVRRLFNCAIDTESLNTEHILTTKNDKDLKYEKDMAEVGTSSATSLAAKEARIDRNRNFWNSSKWARKLTKSVTGFLSKEQDSKPQAKRPNDGQGALMDTSSISRQLAGGTQDAQSIKTAALADSRADALSKRKDYNPDLFLALSRTYAVVVARWGGGGKDDIVRKGGGSDRSAGEKEYASSRAEPFTLSLLNVLCFSTPLVKAAWGMIQSNNGIVTDVYAVIDADRGKTPVRTLRVRPSFKTTRNGRRSENDGAALLYMFVCALSHILIITDDVEIHDMDRPLPLHQIRRCIQVLKKLLYRACCIDNTSASMESNYFGLALISAASRTMRDLYDRSSRRPLCVPKLWLVPDLMDHEIKRCKEHSDYVSLLSSPVLRVCPFLVSFKRRLKLFERIITTSRVEIQGENSQNPFHTNPLKPGIPVRITRGRLLEDGLATMNNLGRNMRQRITVHYVNEAGARESGVDAGGLFKEFWTDLSALAFNPNYALFRVTDGAGNCLYPNPSSGAAHGSDHIILFEFLGRILGKALYEGITIHPRFAHFFLSFLRGDYNFLHMLPDLSTVDPQLYHNLMFLKTYEGDAEDLCLTFTITNDEFGGNKEIPLIPNGANVEVTNTNKQRYVGLVAKYYVVDRVREQSEAFTRGLWEVIDRSWLRLFNEPELQVLISGASDGKIDVEDMRANTRYAGGYTGIDRTVNRFWHVVASFEPKHQAELLRFVTSCERPPPLGFASMNPPFTIQRVGILRDGDKLPTASTCFNTLKLPTYSSEKVLRQRLIYAIESGAGFELT